MPLDETIASLETLDTLRTRQTPGMPSEQRNPL